MRPLGAPQGGGPGLQVSLSGLALALAFFAGAGAGCPARSARAPDHPSMKNRMRPGHAPTPFSASEIRKACPPGHSRRYLVEIPDRPPLLRVLSFEGGTDDSTEFVSSQTDTKGRPFGEQRRVRARWTALQAHASFPRAATTIKAVTVITPAGAFPSWLYEVRGRTPGEIDRYWFAKALPGSPVQYERREAGKLVFRMVLLGLGRPRPAPAAP